MFSFILFLNVVHSESSFCGKMAGPPGKIPVAVNVFI
jgi:hypothetical protein